MMTLMQNRIIDRLMLMSVLFMLLSCAPTYEHWEADEPAAPADVKDQAQVWKHTVQAGESLHAIAWVYNVNYLDLAQWNNIQPPRYIIHPGQQIELSSSDEPAKKPSLSQTEVSRLEETPAVKRKGNKTNVKKPAATNTQDVAPSQQSVPPEQLSSAAQTSWAWPTPGKPLCKFVEDQCRRGLFIGGNLGQPIVAAFAGDVVYSGGGFKEYGALIIIKHHKGYLSAYAHNHSLLVKEGDTVVGGQKIATMGQANTGQAALYFQIRRNGKLINPLQTLPKRASR